MQNTLPNRTLTATGGSYAATGMQMPNLLKTAKTGKPASAVAVLFKIVAPITLTACLWSKVWLGTAGASVLGLAALVMLIFAPKFFEPSLSRLEWARSVGFGEKIWLNRMFVPVPQSLSFRLTTLYLVFWAGVLVALWGGFATLPLLSVTGLAVAYSAQFTCFGKLIYLYKVMRDKYPLYRFWAATPVNDNSARAANRHYPRQQSA